MQHFPSIVLIFTLALLTGCQNIYYDAWEKLGVEKRDILVDRVEGARDAQEDAQQQFSSALEEFSTLIAFDGGNLEKTYENLSDEYQNSVSAAEKVSNRIASIESVAQALFDEWEDEIDQYTNQRFKTDSQRQLRDTKSRYRSLQKSLHNAESAMAPVLSSMKDNVLYLKHNLNAQAIGALKGEYQTIKRDIDQLIQDMNTAINRSNQFIASMKK